MASDTWALKSLFEPMGGLDSLPQKSLLLGQVSNSELAVQHHIRIHRSSDHSLVQGFSFTGPFPGVLGLHGAPLKGSGAPLMVPFKGSQGYLL